MVSRTPRSHPQWCASRPPGDVRPYPGFPLTGIRFIPGHPLPRPHPHGRYVLLNQAGRSWLSMAVFTHRWPEQCHLVLTGLQYPCRRRHAKADLSLVPLVYRVPSWPPTQRLALPYALASPRPHPRARVYLLPSLWDWDTPLTVLAPWVALLPLLTPDHVLVLPTPPTQAPERVYLARRVLRAALFPLLPLQTAQRLAQWVDL